MDKPVRPAKNLHTDASYVDQPENTTRFVLNGVDETNQGDRLFISVEESNEQKHLLPDGYIPLDEVNISNGDKVIFLVSLDEQFSEIGIIDKEDNYTTIVNSPDLGFKITQQINSIYRLRRGCERTIYWVDPKVRYFNIDKPEQFKTNGEWDVDKFSLAKTYDRIPLFEDIEVLENGIIPPGSYNFAIQYVDEDLNPTEWITTSPVINIYNDSFSKAYNEIRGSTNKKVDYQNFGPTNKSIRLTFSNLDTSYTFYRIAVIEASNATGIINQISVSQEISTQIKMWEYTGEEALSTITEEEIQEFRTIIDEAEFIEQIENTLILSNVRGKATNYCKLQKYASRIKADVTLQTVILNELTDTNSKKPEVKFHGVGYMPGEIYSFGIVYVFEDGTLSPVYHIPGKNHATENVTFHSDQALFPMSIDNQLQNTYYTDNSSCSDFWGLDSEGENLKNKLVRHHRFPLRSEINKPLLVKEDNVENIDSITFILNITGEIDAGYTDETIDFVVSYSVNGNISYFEGNITVANYDSSVGLSFNIVTSNGTIVPIDIYENGVEITFGTESTTGLTYNVSSSTESIELNDTLYTSEIMGIRFSGVDIPSEKEIGRKITGYYIVRNHRTESNKTIVDTGVVTPLLDETIEDDGYFVAHGHIMPNLNSTHDFQPNITNKIKEDVFGLIHPEHRFNRRQYPSITELIQEGEFVLKGGNYIGRSYSSVVLQDVMAGTSYDPEVAKRRERDSDGFSLHTLTRDSEDEYVKINKNFAEENDINEIFYLDTLTGKTITDINDNKKEIFNVSADNKIGIIHLNKSVDRSSVKEKLPYVVMKRNLSNPYSSFRYLEYHKDVVNRTQFIVNEEGELLSGDITDVFGGDSYITPMRYHSAVLYDIRLRKRASKKGILNIILGVVLIIVGAVLTYFGNGIIGVPMMGYGISQISTGIKKDNIAKVYGELYDAGLRNCVDDSDTQNIFGMNPADDEIQWLGDTVTNLWFESSVNMNIRNGVTVGLTDFLNAPASKAKGRQNSIELTVPYVLVPVLRIPISDTAPQNELDSYLIEKVTTLDTENDNGRLYHGFPYAEFYELNLDYQRVNRQKIFNALGIEYDCCSDCRETFPHRTHYSLQSFQEELTDNYRIFLPNNYKDMEGEKGVITGLYRWYNNIYIHTEEALWHLPQNYQERITGDIVSFLGTGSFFETPPRRITDGEESSAGTMFGRGVIKSKHGIIFPSGTDMYLFNGEKLERLSENNYNWFKDNMSFLAAKQYYNSNKRNYPFLNNPSNPFGIGFISTYDTRKERLIVTKKDFSLSPSLISNDDYELTMCDGNLIIFNDYEQTIQYYKDLGYEYVGIIDCQMVFSIESVQEVEVTELVWVPPVIEYYTKTYFQGFWEEDDPAHPGGGSVTYLTYPNGTENTINELWSNDCLGIEHLGILETHGCSSGCKTEETIQVIIEEGYYTEVTKIVEKVVIDYVYIDGEVVENPIDMNNSWTMSYSLKTQSWVSWHSYIPDFYLYDTDRFYSWKNGNNYLWKHNKLGHYQTFYGTHYPHIIEMVFLDNPTSTKIWEWFKFQTEARQFDTVNKEFLDKRFITHNKILVYNTRQSSGILDMIVKDTKTNEEDYLLQQTEYNPGEIVIDRNDKDWTINDLRDLVTLYSESLFKKDLNSLQSEYYIDKVVNQDVIDINKDWTELESFRDKFLVVRFIFDNFDNVQLITNYSVSSETDSKR